MSVARMMRSEDRVVKEELNRTVNQCATVSASSMVLDRCQRIKLIAVMLKVKQHKKEDGKVRQISGSRETSSGKYQRIFEPYHRLSLARDLTDGSIFYAVSRTSDDSLNHFTKKTLVWPGTAFTILNPVLKFFIKDVPCVESRHAYIPLNDIPLALANPFRAPEENFRAGDAMKSVYVASLNVQIQDPDLVENCGSVFCDAQHSVHEKCPAFVTASTKVLIMDCSVSLPDAGIHDVRLRSRQLTALFLSAEAMQLRNAEHATLPRLEDSIDAVLQYYRANGIRWTAVGWFKPGYTSDTHSKPSRVHISQLAPETVLAGAPLMQPPLAEHQHEDVAIAEDAVLPGIVPPPPAPPRPAQNQARAALQLPVQGQRAVQPHQLDADAHPPANAANLAPEAEPVANAANLAANADPAANAANLDAEVDPARANIAAEVNPARANIAAEVEPAANGDNLAAEADPPALEPNQPAEDVLPVQVEVMAVAAPRRPRGAVARGRGRGRANRRRR